MSFSLSATFNRKEKKDLFGWSTTLSDDGSTLVVGAVHHDDAGSIEIYKKENGNWIFKQLISGIFAIFPLKNQLKAGHWYKGGIKKANVLYI